MIREWGKDPPMIDFEPSESQRILLRAAKGFLAKEGKDFLRRLEKVEEAHSREVWRKMAELGWMGLPFPEAYGGYEGSILDLALLFEEMGKALIPSPLIPTLSCGLAILRFGTEEQKREFLPAISRGERIVSPARVPSTLPCPAQEAGGAFMLTGKYRFVPYGHVADWLLLPGLLERGDTAFLVDGTGRGIQRRLLKTLVADGQTEVACDRVEVPEKHLLGGAGEGRIIWEWIEAYGALFHSAFIVGILERVLTMAVDYAKQREQFGKPIGSFQAIQHQCADMMTAIEKVKYLTYEAAWKCREQEFGSYEISAAKAMASDAAREVCMLGIKIHGGVGITEEHDLQLYFRMAKSAEFACGDGDYHRQKIARVLTL